ncbi:MAG TPA: GNAT family protein [Blastocatellia bacterium]|nr:GNAT family protein [Blastocatellia bacterium]
MSREGGANAAWQRERGLAAPYRRLVDGMEIRLNFWQGKNVRLRGIEPSDADIFFAWNMDSEMARRLDFVWPPVSQAQVKREIEELSQKKLEHDSFTWVIEDTSGAAVGSISTHNCNARNGTFSYGVGVVREHQRKGYAAEAIQMILKYYFEELRYQKVSVAVHSYNEESIALHEKLGFVREGTLRRMIYTRGEYFDVYWYGMTKEEWERSG